MEIADLIRQERGSDTVAGILSCDSAESTTTVAAKFGLADSSDCYREIDAAEATKVLESVLHKDMAYDLEIMPLQLAEELSAQFIAEFSEINARFFTNGFWGRLPRYSSGVGPGWNPVTSATFDAGVIVVADQKVGCVWCLDED